MVALFSFFGIILSIFSFMAIESLIFPDDFEEPGSHRNQALHDFLYTRDQGLHDMPDLFYVAIVLTVGLFFGYLISKIVVRIFTIQNRR